MSPHKKESLLHALDILAEFANSLAVDTECHTCIHYNENVCDLCDEEPPKEVLKTGCKNWEFNKDSCPF